MGTKRHLWPLDVFSELLVHPKWTCGRGSNSSLLPHFQEPLPPFWPSVLNFTISPGQISGYARGLREQSKLLQMVPLQRKG